MKKPIRKKIKLLHKTLKSYFKVKDSSVWYDFIFRYKKAYRDLKGFPLIVFNKRPDKSIEIKISDYISNPMVVLSFEYEGEHLLWTI